MIERTLLLIKPNATLHHHIGDILTIIEQHGYDIVQLKVFHFSHELAERFYAEHKGKDFYQRLTDFMTSGKIVGALLEKDNAVLDLRDLIGSTNPENRKPGTIRAKYAESYNENAVHASDSHDHALREIALIFPDA